MATSRATFQASVSPTPNQSPRRSSQNRLFWRGGEERRVCPAQGHSAIYTQFSFSGKTAGGGSISRDRTWISSLPTTHLSVEHLGVFITDLPITGILQTRTFRFNVQSSRPHLPLDFRWYLRLGRPSRKPLPTTRASPNHVSG